MARTGLLLTLVLLAVGWPLPSPAAAPPVPRRALPEVRVVPATFTEPSLGHRLGFTEVRLSHPSTRRVVVELKTRNGTARAGQDFVRLFPTVVFKPGQTSRPVSVELLSDERLERVEYLHLAILSASHAVPVRGGKISVRDAPGGRAEDAS